MFLQLLKSCRFKSLSTTSPDFYCSCDDCEPSISENLLKSSLRSSPWLGSHRRNVENFITVLLSQAYGYFPPNFTVISEPDAFPLSTSPLILEHLALRSIKPNTISSSRGYCGWNPSLCHLIPELLLSSLCLEWEIYLYLYIWCMFWID